MELYSKRRRWKLIILFVAIAISLISLTYTNRIVNELKLEERKKMELYAFALQKLADIDDLEGDVSLLTEITTRNTTVPLILTNSNDSILAYINFKSNASKKEIYKQLQQIKDIREPIIIRLNNNDIQKIYYKDSTVLSMLFWYPIVQIMVFSLFILFAYLAFSNTRKAEQNRVWVGLSKETAHQLGTPISSLMAWVEILKTHEELKSYIPEIEKDINSLNNIAQRFSKIGSIPELKPEPIVPLIKNALSYMQYRTSGKVNFTFNCTINPNKQALLNKSLFEWVIENLVRNAVDAMQGQGDLTIDLIESGSKIIIDVTDTGKGIPKRIQKTVFNPGYTTKQRGWGLGLSLSRRIIENYHNGKIFVKSSELNKGTTFRVILNS